MQRQETLVIHRQGLTNKTKQSRKQVQDWQFLQLDLEVI